MHKTAISNATFMTKRILHIDLLWCIIR